MIDYGTIVVRFHENLTYDQKATIVRQSIDNQLCTEDRMHYIEILGESINMCKFIDDPDEIRLTFKDKYTCVLKFEIYENVSGDDTRRRRISN